MTEWLIVCSHSHSMPMVDALVIAFNNRDVEKNTITLRCLECGEEREINLDVLLGT